MWSLFKKVGNVVKSEVNTLENFVYLHAEHLRSYIPLKETVAHVPGQTIQKENRVLTYRISQEQCEDLKNIFASEAKCTPGESDESFFGSILHEGQEIGFYLGKSYEYGTYWARFWLD